MARTTAGRALTEQHRRRQLALRALTLRQLLAMWPAFDLDDIDRSWSALEPGLVALAQARHRDAAGITVDYLARFHDAERVPGSPVTRLAPVPDAAVLARSLRFTGPITAKQLISAGRRDVVAQTLTHLSGNVTRLTLAGGRDTLLESVKADPRALGYARVSDGRSCSFCAMLVSRGPVYDVESVGFEAHNHCGCAGEPVFDRDQPWPDGGRDLQTLWSESTKGTSGPVEARRAFRRAYEGR